MKNYPLGEQPAQRESAGRAGELPGQDTDMLDATALCGHNRVKSVHMVFIEPQSESQGPGEGRPPLVSGTFVKSPEEVGVQIPGGSPGCSPQPVDGFPSFNICYKKSLEVRPRMPNHHCK